MPEPHGLLGHWPLTNDFDDVSGHGRHGHNQGVAVQATGALFNGSGAHLVVPSHPAIELGGSDFSVSMWISNPAPDGGVLGDILSKYSHSRRTGFTLGFLDFPGSVYSTPNSRNLSFGIAADTVELPWTDCGRPGNALHVFTLCSWNGDLYAGTFEAGEDESGKLYRWDGDTGWIDCGSPDGSNTVMSLCAHDGNLYCGTGCYRASGSALSDSPNTIPGGRVYRYVAPGEFVDCGRIAEDAAEAHSLTVFNGELYAIPSYTSGVFRWDGNAAWEYCGAPGDRRCMTLGVHDGDLFAGGNEYSGVWRYKGGKSWESIGTQSGPNTAKDGQYPVESQIYSFMTWDDALHIGTWPSGSVFRYEGGSDWTFCGRLGEELEVMCVATYNGSFYAGTLPLAQVYRYDGGEEWTLTGRVDHTPDVTYRRAWSMAVYDGTLFCGTLPSGHVWRYRAGACATHDHWLPPGTHHLAAVRSGSCLRLYVDGKLVSSSKPYKPNDYDLSNGEPLIIGGGPRSSFRGGMRDVRLYGRELAAEEIAQLSQALS